MSAATRAAWAEKVLAMIGCSERGHAPTANGKFCARCGFRLPKDGTP